jgi:hypothetical protein
MDERILSSRGAYVDRNEFVAEAIWDRLTEDADRDGDQATIRAPWISAAAGAAPRGVGHRAPAEAEDAERLTAVPESKDETAVDPVRVLADVVARGHDIPALPRRGIAGTIFGLHNRDLPTIWIVAELAQMAVAEAGTVPWPLFVSRIRSDAQAVGTYLRDFDKRAKPAVKSSVGFPKTGDKARSSEDRLITTALGAPGRNGVVGPAVLLGLVASDDRQPRPAVGPTAEGLRVLGDLVGCGFGLALPQPEAATRTWLAHISSLASEEHAAWLQVLRVIADKPTRTELVERFPQWPGTTADTNTAGYVSRGREWGLVLPELLDGRYRLTPLGEHIVAEGDSK